MSQIIASTYEIKEKIGSGGAGVVYLGRHLRLDIPVVLKADKRTLTANREALRREVDALKNLNHTYIPQVYDFVVEGDTVYTVMAYIEGESLDKPLRRGESFRQAQVITWACQLLEALVYLHSQPPYGILHSDIKPANIMLTPQGSIRLIDFNIALALGEEGTVRVGFSQGYASPEHYGIDYSDHTVVDREEEETELLDGSSEYARVRRARQTSPAGSGRRTVLLDVRSDIYCLGATLYHLLTGVRPPADAKAVAPISAPSVSPAVAQIISKAMSPAPEHRYQSAQEMLYAFEHLHENDPRAVRHKRRAAVAAGVLSTLFLAGGLCTFVGLKQMERLQAAQAEEERAERQALAAVTASREAYQGGDIPQAIRSARDALSTHTRYDAQAQKALTDAIGVYDLAGGFKAHRQITLPGEPQKLALSPEGTRTAVMTGEWMTVYDTESGQQLVQLPKERSALADVVFLDEDRLLYAGDGGLCAYDLDRREALWTGRPATSISVSADGSAAAAVYRDESRAVVYDTADGTVLQEVDFQGRKQKLWANDTFTDPGYNLFALNGNGTLLAVSFVDGSLWIYDLLDSGGSLIIFDGSDYARFEGGFHGSYFAFSAATGDGRDALLSVIDIDTLTQPVNYWKSSPFHVQADERGIFVSYGHTLVRMDTETWIDRSVAYSNDAEIADFDLTGDCTLTILKDGALAFYDGSAVLTDVFPGETTLARVAGGYGAAGSANTPQLRIFKREEHDEARFFSYDPALIHDEARVSADGGTVMFFQHDRFQLFSLEGQLLREVEFPDKGSVYDTQYRRDELGSYLEVIYNDGRVRSYSAADGSLLSERMGGAPDLSMDEEFYTEQYRISSSLHGTPQVYDRTNGEFVCLLEEDGYLTYVTELDGGMITEYISADGKRYGLLLNESFEVLAVLPDLCDISADGTLYFDDGRGTVRQSRLYSLEELLALAEH